MPLQNYFNYYTEIEERFQGRRGSLLMLSTLDWALIATWQEAGVPLEAVLRGIDAAFDKYEARKTKGRTRRVNGLAWCAQAVMEAAEQMRDAAVGAEPQTGTAAEPGFGNERIAAHLQSCRDQLLATATVPEGALAMARETAARLGTLVEEVRAQSPQIEQLEATLRTLEEKLLAMLLATSPEAELHAMRAQAASQIAPYRGKMQALQIRQIEQQFLEKRLVESYAVPRLSLFYMRNSE